MIVTKTKMNDAQQAFMAEIDAIVEPLQAEVMVINAEEQEAMKVVHEIRARKKAAQTKILPYAMIKPALVSTRSRMKYFPEFYGRTADEVDDGLLANAGMAKDTPEDITRFITDMKQLLV